jgi:hypothetical protein
MPTRDLTPDLESASPSNEWDTKLMKYQLAQSDIESPDVQSDAEILYYSDIRETALRDVIFHPLDCPARLQVKIALMFQDEFNADWCTEMPAVTQVLQDLQRIKARLKTPN